MKERNILIDCLKGFAILLVVLGHAIQYNYSKNFDSNIIFKTIYTFHMPFFMFLSGYVAYGSFDGSWKKFVKRFKTLVIPFLAWFFVSYIINVISSWVNHTTIPNLKDLLLRLYKKPDTGLWFLWVLFLNYVLLFISLRITKKLEIVILILFSMALNYYFYNYPFNNYLGLGLISWHSVFFLTAYGIHKYQKQLPALKWWVAIVCFAFYCYLFQFYNRIGSPLFYNKIAAYSTIPRQIIVMLYYLALPFSVIYFIFYSFSVLVNFKTRINSFLIYFGNLSLEIYSTHFYFFQLTIFLTWLLIPLKIIVTIALVIVLSLSTQYLIKKVNFLSIPLYGKGKVKDKFGYN